MSQIKFIFKSIYMATKAQSLSEIKEIQEQHYRHPEQNKSFASSSVRAVGASTHQLIDPRNRVHRTGPLPPHQFTRTPQPIRDTSTHPLPPHQFTKSRLNQQPIPPNSKPESYVEWIPYQRKIVDFKDETRVQKKPVKKVVQDYREELRYDEVPRQRTGLDYYAVQRIKKYVPVQYDERQTIMVEKMVPYKKTIYVPRTRQVYHGPNPSNLPIYDEGSAHVSRIEGNLNQPPSQNISHNINLAPQSHHQSRSVSPPTRNFLRNPEPQPQQQFQHAQRTSFSPLSHQRTNLSPLSHQRTGFAPSLHQINSQSMNITRKQTHKQLHSSDSYESYIPSFRY